MNKTTNTYSKLERLIEKLAMARGVSGYEMGMGISRLIYEEIKSFSDGVEIDQLGNVVAGKGGGDLSILLEAHLDEVGVCITNQIGKNRYQFVGMGWLNIARLKNEFVEFKSDSGLIKGKICTFKNNPQTLADYYIETDSSQDLQIGLVGVFAKFFSREENIISAVGLDNRVGCAVLIELLKNLPDDFPYRILTAFTVQEEQGEGLGAYLVASRVNPDICFVIDSAYARPFSGSENWFIPELGKGPALQLVGEGFVISGQFIEIARKIAETKRIPYQYEIPDRAEGATNVKAIQLAAPAARIIGINIPVRYQDSPRTEADLRDVYRTVQLLIQLVYTNRGAVLNFSSGKSIFKRSEQQIDK